MGSKYLSSLSRENYDLLTEKLLKIQNYKCFICNEEIDPILHSTNIDHIVPLANRGKDIESNFAVTHETCNKTKLDADLEVARILFTFKKINDISLDETNKPASLKNVLSYNNGSQYDFKYDIRNKELVYSFSKLGKNDIIKIPIYIDNLSKEKTCFIEVPIEYIFHDETINPRGINNSISKLIKEFRIGNPQLHTTLARIDENRIKVFDGQHKAAAQILLGQRTLLLRLFIEPNVDRLTETNTNAGSALRQIAFDKSIMRQLNNTLYNERVKKYQSDHSLPEDDYSFSEQELVDYFKGENVNIKKYIVDSIKHSITNDKDNKLKDYIDFEGKAKELPLSYSAYDKTFLARFINSKNILNTPINYRSYEGLNPREIEIRQLVRLSNIIAEELYINKYIPEIGLSRIEDKIINKRDQQITDDHLIAYRMSKEEILYNWLQYIENIIKSYCFNTGTNFNDCALFQSQLNEQVWINIRTFISNFRELPLWKDRSMASTIFSGKQYYDYWKSIFTTGKSPDNVPVLANPINYIEMIKK